MNERSRLSAISSGLVFLSIGSLASRLSSAVGTILIIRLLGPYQYGLVGIVLAVPSFLVVVGDLGMSTAVTKFVAQYSDDPRIVKSILISASIFVAASNLLLMSLCYFSASFIASTLLQRPEIEHLIRIAAVFVLVVNFYNLGWALLIGLKRTEFASGILVLKDILRAVFSVFLIVIGLSASGPIIGQNVAFFLTGFIAYLFVITFGIRITKYNTQWGVVESFQRMFQYGIPIAVGTLLNVIQTQFGILIISMYCIPTEVGYYTTADGTLRVLSILIFSLSSVLLPVFSELKSRGERQKYFELSAKHASLVLVPLAVWMAVLSGPLVYLLYGSEYLGATLLVSLLGLKYVFWSLVYVSFNFVCGIGETKVITKLSLVQLICTFAVLFALTPFYGIMAIIFSDIFNTLLWLVLCLKHLWKNHGISVKSSVGIYMSSAAMGACLLLFSVFSQNLQTVLKLLLSIPIGLLSYLVIVPLIGAIDNSDIRRLREMLRSLKPLDTILGVMLTLMEKILSVRL